MGSKKIFVIFLVIALCCSMVFGILWQREKNDTSDLEQVCITALTGANCRLVDYLDHFSAYDYHYAVAEMEAFYDAYCVYRSKTAEELRTNCVYANQLIGELMDYPDLTKEQVEELISITCLLIENIDDENAYHRIFALYNELTR